MEQDGIYGLLAEFDHADALVAAANRTRESGYRRFDAYSPFPVDGLAEAVGFHDTRVLWLTLVGGIFGALLAYAMQVYVNLDFPLNVGGRPVVAPPAFLVVAFELLILFAVLFPVIGMLAMNGLPRLHHPLFSVDRFQLASKDRFFLCIESDDPMFDLRKTRDFLEALGPVSIAEVPQ